MKITDNSDFIVGDDGYYVFWPTENKGAYTAHHLRQLADRLDEMNSDWDKIVQDELSA